MNRLDRLFAIATVLQSRSRVRAEDLAARFEVSKRTIYRDITALAEAGVPVVSLPGQGYRLADGFSLPPLVFTPAEATALLFGARLLATQASGAMARAADDAIAKVAAVLDETTRRNVEEIDATVTFFPAASGDPPLDLTDARVTAIREAITRRRAVALRYRGRNREEASERLVEPQTLTFGGNAWYLSGYCRLRGGERAFRLDRIEHLAVTDEAFRPRAAAPAPPPATIDVRVRLSPLAARIARERQHWSFVREDADPGGAVAVYAPHRLDEIASWLLGWGTAAEVIAPPELRERLRAEALRLAELLT